MTTSDLFYNVIGRSCCFDMFTGHGSVNPDPDDLNQSHAETTAKPQNCQSRRRHVSGTNSSNTTCRRRRRGAQCGPKLGAGRLTIRLSGHSQTYEQILEIQLQFEFTVKNFNQRSVSEEITEVKTHVSKI